MVNVNDVIVEDMGEVDCRLSAIFQKQAELIEKYHPIEEKSGLRHTVDVPINIHDPKGQAQLKDYAWRFIEELGEALEAFNLHPGNPEHCDEELMDALHFLVEFTIHAGYTPQELIDGNHEDLLDALYDKADEEINNGKGPQFFNVRDYPTLLLRSGMVLEEMAKTCNTLKNKPWKQSHMLTDTNKFGDCLKATWAAFIALCYVAEIHSQYLFELYLSKNAVNKFRQRSNY